MRRRLTQIDIPLFFIAFMLALQQHMQYSFIVPIENVYDIQDKSSSNSMYQK